MRYGRAAWLPTLAVFAGAGAGVAGLAEGADPASTLKDKGLSRAGRVFLIEDEKAAIARIKEARDAVKSYAAFADRQAMAEQVATRLAEIEENRSELQQGVSDLNQQIVEQSAAGGSQGMGPGQAGGMGQGGGMGRQGQAGGLGQGQGGFQQQQQRIYLSQMIAQRDQMKMMLNNVSAEQKDLKEQSSQTSNRGSLEAQAKTKREALKAKLEEVKASTDEVSRKYATLAADPSVKLAIADLERSNKADFRVGPSDAFRAGVKELDQLERKYLDKDAPRTASTKATSASKKRTSRSKR